jgi:molybdenum cofactor cytidylyltransferase
MARMATVGAVILAAGASRRMGVSKALLDLEGRTLVSRVLAVFREAGVEAIRVVTRPDDAALVSTLAELRAHAAVNPRPEEGMFSSVRVGVKALPAGLDAFFVHPVDIPFVSANTLRLLTAAIGGETLAVHPAFNGRRGHPPLLADALRTALERYDGPGGLRAFLSRYEARTRELECADRGILSDLDTPEDVRAAVAALRARDKPRGGAA